MSNSFSRNIAASVEAEVMLAMQARTFGNEANEFGHLENAHVIGQESTYWHVKVHFLILLWAVRNRQVKEIFGQLFRIVGAATKTVFGLIPQGNTGGAGVSPFKVMPIKPEHRDIISRAKAGA